MKPISAITAAILAVNTPGLLLAHTGDGANAPINLASSWLQGVFAGFLHPLLGIDHLLVLVALGLYVAFNMRSGTRQSFAARFALLLFVAALGGNYFAAAIHSVTNIVELAVSTSVIFAGLLLLLPMKAVWFGAASWVFALLHGSVHGAEIPAGSFPLSFSIGMAIASALVILAAAQLGLGIRTRLEKPSQATVVQRLAGCGISLLGMMAL